MDVREKDFNRAEKWWEENVLNNRAHCEFDSHSANLVIDHVVESDAAMYRCRVDFKYAQTRNSKVNLTIIGMIFFSLLFLLSFSFLFSSFIVPTAIFPGVVVSM